MQTHYLRVPVRVVDDDRVGGGEVETQTAGARAERVWCGCGWVRAAAVWEWEEIIEWR